MDQIKRHVLNINSSNKTSGTNENFIIHLNENEFHEVKYVQLKDISFPNTIYNITSSNNKLNWYDTTTAVYNLTIPIGYYTVDDFITYVNTTTTTNATYAACKLQITKNKSTRKLSLSVILGGNAFQLNATSTIQNIIGFPNLTSSFSLVHVATEIYNFLVTRYVHVISNTLSEPDALISSNGKKYGIIATIPVEVPFGYIVSKSEEKDSSDESFHNANVNLSTIDIKLVDSNFKQIELNGSDVIINFTVSRI